MSSWTDAFKSFDAQSVTGTGADGTVIDFERVVGAVGVQWVIDNPNGLQMNLQLEGSLDAVNFFDMGVDVLIIAGASLPAASVDDMIVATGKAARWVRASVAILGGSSTSLILTATAIVTAEV